MQGERRAHQLPAAEGRVTVRACRPRRGGHILLGAVRGALHAQVSAARVAGPCPRTVDRKVSEHRRERLCH